MRGEFELIAHYLAPLTADAPGAFGLTDDGAVLAGNGGPARVITLDTLVAGTHYLPQDPSDLVARKALRVNLSDLAAMGARPESYLLSLALAPEVPESWVDGFAQGLRADQANYGVTLLGGDTTRTAGPTTISVTAVGSTVGSRVLRRNGARVGDGVYVSGTIGDAALGLAVARGGSGDDGDPDSHALAARYRLPQPRVDLGTALCERGLASAAIDISDGLIADLGHICRQSGVGAEIGLPRVPLSTAAQRRVEMDAEHLRTALTGGDDYELAFTAPPESADAIAALARELDLPLTRIGELVAGEEVVVRDSDGRPVRFDHLGWTHF